MSIPHHIKYKSNPSYKTIYSCIIPYFIMFIMIDPKVSEDPKNELINPWPKLNSMALIRMMINI